jgi:pyrroline-5-carboxylate reductase
MKILIIGGGNMGLTYARAFLHAHIVAPMDMLILEKNVENAQKISKQQIGIVNDAPGAYIQEADLIILAVKPQDFVSLASTIKGFLSSDQLVLSIMAGVPIDKISSLLQVNKIVRAMPNLPAQIGVGMTVYTSTNEVTRVELVTVQNLLNSTGKTLYVETEDAVDASTAISGSGPAYVFFYIQNMINSAIRLGFSKAEAEILAYQTFRGTIELYNSFDLNCNEWIKKVSSRGGTTEAAFNVFENKSADKILQEALVAAYNRAKELSK